MERTLPLGRLLACIGREVPAGFEDFPITGLDFRAENLGPQSIGFGIKDWHGDYHEQVMQSDAGLIVVDRPVANPSSRVITVENANRALSRMAATFYEWPRLRFPVIGVTGTNGKTTIITLVEQALQSLGWKMGSMGTLGAKIAGESYPLSRTTPNPPELYQIFSKMAESGCDAAVMEVGSFGLRAHRVDDLGIHVGVFTNLTRDHLDVHESMEVYGAAKARLFECLRPVGGLPRALLCRDDPFWEKMGAPMDHWTYGFASGSDLRIHSAQLSLKGSSARLQTPMGDREIHCSLPGRYNLQNMAAAIGILLLLEIPLDQAIEAIEAVAGPPGRMEFIPNDLGLNLVVDYAHNPHGLESALKTLKPLTKGDLWLLFGCGGYRDMGKRPQMGRVASEFADRVVLTSENSRTEAPEQIVAEIRKGMSQSPTHVELDRPQAIEWMIRAAQAGDTLLFAGMGHERSLTVGEQVYDYDETAIIQKVINQQNETAT